MSSSGTGSPNRLLYSCFVGCSSSPPPPPSTTLTLSTSGSTTKSGYRRVLLTWSPPGGSANVDVFRNGALLLSIPNDGSHTDTVGRRITGTFTYKVCLAGTSTCSNESSVTFS